MQETDGKTDVAARYAKLVVDRDHFATRADECAKLTIPTLFMKDQKAARNMAIKDPEQSVGTQGVNTMAAKMVIALFPGGVPFYKYGIDEVGVDLEPEQRRAAMKGLGRLERQVMRDIENTGDINAFNEVIKHLLVVGNVCLFVSEKTVRLYNLNKYVVKRDADGDAKEAILLEEVSPEDLPADFMNKLIAENQMSQTPSKGLDEVVEVYTHIRVGKTHVEWHQEVKGQIVPDSESKVPLEGNPWLFLRYIKVDGEDYGRSLVEMYLGDLRSMEVLSKALNDAAEASSRVLWLVRPNGSTSLKVLSDAPNMAVRSGNADDITTLQLDKSADMRVAKDVAQEIARRLAYAFMMRADVMRDAERVTAEEVRIVARELDEANGGVYSMLSREFQLPYIKRRLFLMRKRAKIKKLPEGVTLSIITGFAALGRAGEGDKIMSFVERAATVMAAKETLGRKVKLELLVEKLAEIEGIDMDDLFYTEDEMEANDTKETEAATMQQATPELIKQAGPMLQAAAQQQGMTDAA